MKSIIFLAFLLLLAVASVNYCFSQSSGLTPLGGLPPIFNQQMIAYENMQLMNIPARDYIIDGGVLNKDRDGVAMSASSDIDWTDTPKRYFTLLLYKVDDNLNYNALIFQTSDDKYLDVYFAKFEYGSTTKFIWERVKKERFYAQINIYTESVQLSNDFKLIFQYNHLVAMKTANKNTIVFEHYDFPEAPHSYMDK